MKRNAKIEDVAHEAGVSIMSVSRALRGVEGVSLKTREHIIEVAKRLRYSPSSVAGALAAANSTLIGVSVPTLDDSVFAEIFAAMRNNFLKSGFQTVFDTSYYEEAHEEAWVERMIAWRPAGIVLSGNHHSKRTRRLLRRAGIPTLEIWAHSTDPIDVCIGIDHFGAGYQMGQAMVQMGYRSPAYVGSTVTFDKRAEQRRQGFAQAFTEVNIPIQPEIRLGAPLSFEGGRKGTKTLLDSNASPDLIYYLNDHMAFGGLMECEARGISVPEQIGIVGFNGLRINQVLNRRITTTTTPRHRMGERGAQMLMARINGVDMENDVLLPVDISLGDTTQKRPVE